MRRFAPLPLLLLLLLPAPPTAGGGEPPPGRGERVRRMVALTGGRETALAFLGVSLEGNRGRYGDLDAGRWRRIAAVVLEEGEKEAGVVTEGMERAYGGLDDREVEAVIRFASSPAGRKFFAAAPDASAEALRRSIALERRVAPRVRERIGREASPPPR